MATPLPTSLWRLAGAVILLAGPLSPANAAGLKVLSEEDMSKTAGRDGVSFATSLNMEIGSYVFTPYDSASLRHETLTIKGTVLSTFDVVKGASADVGMWTIPDASNTSPLQIDYDLAVVANGNTLGTSVSYKDFVPRGSIFQWTTGPTGGIDLGMATKLSIGQLLFSPNGRTSTVGQMAISGIRVESSETPGNPWVIADLKTQSGKFRLPNDGVTSLSLGVDWPTGADAGTGRLSIDKVAFTTVQTPTAPATVVDLGSSSIGSMQIQHLNIKFR